MASKHKVKQAERHPGKIAKLQGINTLPIYVALVVMFIIYFVFQKSSVISVIFGIAIFFTILALLVIEVFNGVKEEGILKNIVEIGAAILLVLVLWYGLKFALNTNYPLDVVPSCSMLPTLHRGDMIVLRGANQTTLRAPIINITQAQWNKSFLSTGSEAAQCVAYNKTALRVEVSQIVQKGFNIGLLENNGTSQIIVPYQAQQNNTVKFICGTVNVTMANKSIEREAYTTGITVGNTTVMGDLNNSVVVYQTTPSDLFYKDGDTYIVHRVYAILNVSGRYYTLTKGDNNPGLDIQYNNYPASMSQVGGTVIASIPYIGYFKLILSNSFSEPAGCNTTVIQPG